MQITYQKRDGCIIQRYRNTLLPYKIGETTSMGWKVLDIEYEYNNKYYPEYKYDMLIQKDKELYIRKKQMKELLLKEAKTFIYIIIGIILYYIKIRLGI